LLLFVSCYLIFSTMYHFAVDGLINLLLIQGFGLLLKKKVSIV
jgi:hypothetical protein